MLANVFSLALLAVAAVAQDTYSVITPPNPVQCQPVLITWTGGTPPFTLSIIPKGQIGGAAIAFLGENLNDRKLTWTCNQPAGSEFNFKVLDATGITTASSSVTVLPGSSSSCLQGGGGNSSSSASGSATGTATGTGAGGASSSGSGSSSNKPSSTSGSASQSSASSSSASKPATTTAPTTTAASTTASAPAATTSKAGAGFVQAAPAAAAIMAGVVAAALF